MIDQILRDMQESTSMARAQVAAMIVSTRVRAAFGVVLPQRAPVYTGCGRVVTGVRRAASAW